MKYMIEKLIKDVNFKNVVENKLEEKINFKNYDQTGTKLITIFHSVFYMHFHQKNK